MAARRDLGFPKIGTGNLKEQLMRTILRNVRSQGHPYVELREEGKKLIFFCTLCLAPCYSDPVLFNHLKGNLHTERLATAQVTLMKSNPWPFSDGVFFFHEDSDEQNKLLLSDSKRNKFLDAQHLDEESLAVVSYDNPSEPNGSSYISQETESHPDGDRISYDSDQDDSNTFHELVIPSVLQKEEVIDLVVRHLGVAQIGARLTVKDGVSNQVHRIWCEWLGSKFFTTGGMGSPNKHLGVAQIAEHEFALVIFSYNYNLGRMGLLDDFRYLLPFSPHSEADDSCRSRGKKRKSFSNPEDISEASSNQYDSSGEDSQSSINSSTKIMLSGNDDQQVLSRILLSKSMRKQLRNHQRLVSERSCDICQQRMLPNQDVAALMNMKTGKLVCSSRNSTGAFHLFHVSCLIHWILLCEVEICEKQSIVAKTRRRSRRKVKGKGGKLGKKHEMQEKHIVSAFCPECQGTGITLEGEELEKPTIPLSEIFKYKIKLCDAHKAWMKNPEDLQNCSIGFSFPHLQSDEISEETVAPLKFLHFYRAVV